MSNSHPHRLFRDPSRPNSTSNFEVGDGPTGFAMLICHFSSPAGVGSGLLGKAVSCIPSFDPFHLAAKKWACACNTLLLRDKSPKRLC